jgi:hypothetical protein
MTDAEMKLAVDIIAADPTAGDIIQGSGGCRKVRIPGKGRGKSGGYRVVTVYGGLRMPVYLLAVLSKGSAGNFTDAQVAQMGQLAKALLAAARLGRIRGSSRPGEG